MGRKKLEMKRIEHKSSRQVTFCKRRSGLIKKAQELAVLCDVEVSLVIFSGPGKLYEFSSTNSLGKVLERYRRRLEEDKIASRGTNNAENYDSNSANLPSYSELLQTVQRCLEGSDIDQFSVTELLQLESQLDAAVTQTRYRKTQLMMQSVSDLHEQEKILRGENEVLERENYDSNSANLPSYSELLQTVQRCLGGPDIDQFSVTELLQLESQLDAAVTQTRYRKTQLMMQSVSDLHEQEKILRGENEVLEREIAAMKKNVNDSNGAIRFGNNGNNNNPATLHLLQ